MPAPGKQAPATTRLFRASVVVGGATVLALLGTGASYALLDSAALAVPASSVVAGTASLSIANQPSMATMTDLSPGRTIYGAFTVTNTGDVPLELSVQSITGSTGSDGLTAGIAAAASGACPGAAAPVASGSIGVTLEKSGSAGDAEVLCLAVTMSTSSPLAEGFGTDFVATIIGTQP